MKVRVIVPVSAFEPLTVIKKSMESMTNLEREGLDMDITYVIDLGEEDDRIGILEEIARERGIKLFIRKNNRGRRAGALNDGIDMEPYANFFAFFDVDSRPDADFIKRCIEVLEEDKEAVFASGSRYIINEKGIIPRMISVEYELLSYLYRVFSRGRGSCFLHFNGLIGVARGEWFFRERFNEEKMCEDVDMTDRIYLSGKRVRFVNGTRLGEQAPIHIGDLYKQRVRWWMAPLEELSSHLIDFFRANIPKRLKISWLVAMLSSYVFILFLPLVPVYFFVSVAFLRHSYKNKRDFILKPLWLSSYIVIMQVCSLHALVGFMMNKRGWVKMRREAV
ncbi:MAG: glycosyltransferase family 2 protein [Candidatus Methanospirareceae archaeon]